jgi:hypothetical protein
VEVGIPKGFENVEVVDKFVDVNCGGEESVVCAEELSLNQAFRFVRNCKSELVLGFFLTIDDRFSNWSAT